MFNDNYIKKEDIMLFTYDIIEDDGFYSENANILQADILPEDDDVIKWVESNGSHDCWVKCYHKPEMDEDGYDCINNIKCHVRFPGNHPGGNAYWLDPVHPVMIPIYK
jgi:hypothetical protein